MSQELVIEMADLKRFSVVCDRCKTETVFDIARIQAALPVQCPCGVLMLSVSKIAEEHTALTLIQYLKNLARDGHSFRFFFRAD